MKYEKLKSLTHLYMSDAMLDIYNELKDISKNEKRRNAYSTFSWEKPDPINSGFAEFGNLLGAWHAGDVAILAGSKLDDLAVCSMNIAAHASFLCSHEENLASKDQESLFFSLRSPIPSVTMSFFSFMASVSLPVLRSGKLAAEDWLKLASASGNIQEETSISLVSGNISNVEQIKAICRKQQLQANLKLVVIDGSEFLNCKPNLSHHQRSKEYVALLQSLKVLAIELTVLIVLTIHLQRWLSFTSKELEDSIDTLMYMDEDSVSLGVDVVKHHKPIDHIKCECLKIHASVT